MFVQTTTQENDRQKLFSPKLRSSNAWWRVQKVSQNLTVSLMKPLVSKYLTVHVFELSADLFTSFPKD